MANKKLKWDDVDERYYENGVDHCALYTMESDGTYNEGVAWSGITNITESPEGGEANDFYADNIPYASLRSAEKVKGSITAYTYPDEFAACDGSETFDGFKGIRMGQQRRKAFGLAYRSWIGNGADNKADYMLHILYGLTVDPSERSHDTINEDPELEELSWDFSGMPEKLTKGAAEKVIGTITIDSRKVMNQSKLEKIEDKLFGKDNTPGETDGNPPTMLTPDALYDLLHA